MPVGSCWIVELFVFALVWPQIQCDMSWDRAKRNRSRWKYSKDQDRPKQQLILIIDIKINQDRFPREPHNWKIKNPDLKITIGPDYGHREIMTSPREGAWSKATDHQTCWSSKLLVSQNLHSIQKHRNHQTRTHHGTFFGHTFPSSLNQDGQCFCCNMRWW